MDVERRFEEVDKDINLRFVELRESLQDPADSRIREGSAAFLNGAERCLEEIDRQINTLGELLKDMPATQRAKYVGRIRIQKSERNKLSRGLNSAKADSNSSSANEQAQRERLLKTASRLESSNRRLDRSQRIASETENLGIDILTDLRRQGDQIKDTRAKLDEAEGYVNRSLKILKDMGKRWGF